MLNLCQFIGNLGREPEIRTMSNGDKVANLSLGVSRHWKDKSTGERRTHTEWVKFVIFNPHLVTLAENYLKKGSKIYISGEMQTRKWTDQQGVEKYTTEVCLQKFNGELTMLDGRSDGGSEAGGSAPSGGGNDFDDEMIPF